MLRNGRRGSPTRLRLRNGFLNGFGRRVESLGEGFGDNFKSVNLAGEEGCFLLLDSAGFGKVSYNLEEIQESGLFFLEWCEIGSLNQSVSSKLDCIGNRVDSGIQY